MVVCNCWLQSRWRRAWQVSTHAACSALHAEQQRSSSVQTTVALAASHLRPLPARSKESRAVDTDRGVLGPARAAHIPPATKGFTCTANCLADKNLLIMSSPPSPSSSSRSWGPMHELQPAARRFDAIELLIQRGAACPVLNQEGVLRQAQLPQLQSVHRAQ